MALNTKHEILIVLGLSAFITRCLFGPDGRTVMNIIKYYTLLPPMITMFSILLRSKQIVFHLAP